MGDYFDWWIGGGTWYDRQQQEQIASISASQARATSRLRKQLRDEAKRSQDLATRLSKLEDAVVASIELEDLRGVMDNFSDAVATRRFARDVLAQIPSIGRVPSTERPQVPPDVSDYWLHPAVRSVDAALRGDTATESSAADEARRRDPGRTAQFLAAVAILRKTTVADDDLATLWPGSAQVSQYQRALWLAVANGGLGDGARDSLVNALVWALGRGANPEPDEDDSIRLVRVAQPSAARHRMPLDDMVMSRMLDQRWPSTPEAAAAALESLRERVETALQAGASTTAAGEVPEGVADLLAQVVSAGAPAEEPLVARIIELRQALAEIGASTAIATPGLLDEESLDVAELVGADLAESADPGARAVAVRVLREPIERVASRLADKASEQLQDAAEVRASGVTLKLTSLGAVDQDWRRRVAERIAAQTPSRAPQLGQLIGGGAVALLGVVLGIVSAPGWYVLAGAGAILAGYGYWRLRRDQAAAQERTAKALLETEQKISQKSSDLAGQIAISRGRQAAAPEERDRIHAALAAAAPVSG